MALGPKAMGEAIAANLKAKTGKTLEEWLSALDAEELSDKKAILAWLKDQGLGHFQAQLVLAKRDGEPLYDNPEQIVTELFSVFLKQRELYDEIVTRIESEYPVVVNPCKGYIPLYSPKHTIFASFKPTRDGLYVGLIGEHFSQPTVEHKPSLGGSERMQYGIYANTAEEALAAIAQSYNNEMNGGK